MKNPIVPNLSAVFGKKHYSCAPASVVAVPAVREFIVSIVGEVTPLDEMIRLSRHNPDWLHAVKCAGREEYAGAFAIMHLKEEATSRFARNAMRGAEITLDHMPENSAEAKSIYIGSIVSNENSFDRAATLKLYREKIEYFKELSGGSLSLFTRPVSSDGLRISNKMGFKPVHDQKFDLGEMIFAII